MSTSTVRVTVGPPARDEVVVPVAPRAQPADGERVFSPQGGTVVCTIAAVHTSYEAGHTEGNDREF